MSLKVSIRHEAEIDIEDAENALQNLPALPFNEHRACRITQS